jgi:hypothetical protein
MPSRTGTSVLDPVHPSDVSNTRVVRGADDVARITRVTRVSHWRSLKRRVSSLFKRDTDPVSDTFRSLPEIRVTEDMKPVEGCPICLDCYVYRDTLKILPCLHYYHKHCIREWLCKREMTCPMCRTSV